MAGEGRFLRRSLWILLGGVAALCPRLVEPAFNAARSADSSTLVRDPTLAAAGLSHGLAARRERQACLRRFRNTDFAASDFQGGWTSPGNLSAFLNCIYRLRTTVRPPEKVVYAGGVHYPTLIVTNHQHPPVSTSGTQFCWLDHRGTGTNGLSPEVCCDPKYGPNGLESCWDEHFTFELCCKGDVSLGELPHFFVGPAMDINVANAVRQLGTFDLGQSYALQTLCRKGDVVLDIGANIGGFSVPLAERVGPNGEVHAFEPFRKVFQHLNANVALNGLTNVYTYNVALGREEKVVDVFTPDLLQFNFPSAMRVLDQLDHGDAEKSNVRYEQRKEKISVRRLDSFEFTRRIHLVKIDVEFMELEVILGGVELLRRHRPIMWVENEPYFDDPSDRTFVNTMESQLGYLCQTVARLELLCLPGDGTGRDAGTGGLPQGFQHVFRHLHGELKDLKLWKALTEVDPIFSTEVR